jgi:histidinol-phosphatase (PHP family)
MPTFPLDGAYAQMAEAARAGGKMVEVNTSGSYYACAEMFPAPALLKAFCQAGVPCTVGTDAHDPKNVARDITRAYDLMRACGYTEVTVPGCCGNLRTIALES